MKNRLFKIVLSILVIVLAFSFVKVNAGEPEVLTVDGAQIRISEPAGLRFVGSVDASFGEGAKYGFIISRGEYTLEQMQANLATSNAIFVDCGELDGENKFYLNVVNIATSYIEDDITVVACVDIAGEKTYAANAVTRNIKEVAEAAVLDPEYIANDFIDGIANTSTFFLDGGNFVLENSFKISAYNAGSAGTSGITLCTKAKQSSGSGKFWYKVSLKQSAYNTHLFTVVETAVSGATLDSEKDYDYVIGAYVAADVTAVTVAAANKYFYISDFAANAIVKTATDYELLFGNKYLVKDGDILPLVEKDYCDFYGWYDNDLFDGDPIVTKSGNSSEEFYAKFDLHNYSIKYNLNGGLYDGASSIANDSYNINTPTFSLPEAALMSKVDYEFVEWNTKSDGSGTGLSEIVVGSYGDLELYAIWAANAPTEVVLSDADNAAITAYNPTKFVNTDFTAGKFTIGETTYTVGEGELFTSIASALSAASSNDIIYVFAGTYSDNITITTTGVKIVGPNQNKLGNSANRVSEANVAAIITIGANDVELIGIQLSGIDKAITWTSAISNLTIKNVKSTASGKSTTGGRTAIIASDAAVTNLVIDGMYIKCTGALGRNGVAIYDVVNGFKLVNSEFDNGAASHTNSEVVRINKIAGNVVVENNKFIWSTANMSVFLGSSSNACTKMTFVNNILKGSSSGQCTTFGYRNVPSGCTVDFIGNWLEYFDTGNVLSFQEKSGSTINVKYNYFGTSVAYKYSDTAVGTKNQNNNYYVEKQTTATADYGVIDSLDDLISAYKGSTEYTTYGSICVYDN